MPQDDDAAPLDNLELMIPLRRSRCQDQKRYEFTSSTCSTEHGKHRDHLHYHHGRHSGTIETTSEEPCALWAIGDMTPPICNNVGRSACPKQLKVKNDPHTLGGRHQGARSRFLSGKRLRMKHVENKPDAARKLIIYRVNMRKLKCNHTLDTK